MRFLRSFVVVILAFAVGAAPAAPRLDRVLDHGWRFRKGDPAGAGDGFFDVGWQRVSLPHTWNAEDGARGGSYYRGPGWYQLNLKIDRKLEGKSLFLRFGAASLVADVYLNHKKVGHHEGGFGAFCFEITKDVQPGDNLLAVRVDNSHNPDVTPLSGDFTVYGGLYREVRLLALGPVSVSPLDDASSGIYLTSKPAKKGASVNAKVVLRDGLSHGVDLRVVTTIRDADDHKVGTAEDRVHVAAGGSGAANMDVRLEKAHLWRGVADPYLYHAVVKVYDGDDLVDRVEQEFGIRTYRVDPVWGLVLNGKPYDMHGVNVHQGRPSVGWAATAAMQRQDYKMVRELGCTGVRMPHYQHADYEYALCDRLGLVVWAELALVNHVTDSAAFSANVKQQLRELIKQNYNHPSILFWSMYNEPAIDRKRGPKEWEIVKDLVAEAHELDPTRLTTGAVSMGAKQPIDWYMDVTAFNRYWGWYDGEPTLWATRLDALRSEAGGRTFGISEYGAGASVKQHELDPKHPQVGGKWHPEEWQSHVHELAWPELRSRPWIWCKLVWVMFDFASAGRNEGDHAGINDKGLVTGDRKVRKDAFYYYKAQWSDQPFVYITDRRFNPHPSGRQTVKVYSNCDTVELFVNGKSFGVIPGRNHVFTWDAIDLQPGPTKIEAKARLHGKVHRDSLRWTVQATPTPSQP